MPCSFIKRVLHFPLKIKYLLSSDGSPNEIGNAMVNGSRVVGKIAGFHSVPYSLSDYPFPGLRVGGFRHGSPGLRVESQPLRLERRRVEGLVILVCSGSFHLEAPARMRREWKGAEGGHLEGVGCEHKWMW